ncbi:MAG TPA: glycosyltransferase [Flavitalea sp.]|nr:glycosyltransferase [Flavitalea sp.]
MIVGSDQQWSIERLFRRYLIEEGAAVELFGAQNLFYDYYNASLLNKIVFRSGVSSIYKKIDAQLELKMVEFKPDLVWIFKGMEILPATIRKMKQEGRKVINYNPDNPFIFTGKGSGNANVTRSIGLYDLHLTYSREIEQQLIRDYDARTALLPFGYDIPDELYNDCRRQTEVVRCCFLGNPDPQRAKFIMELAEGGLELDLYGNDWDKFVHHKHIHAHPPVYADEFYKTLQRYRVQLNMMRVHNLHSHNMRSFEIPAIGGIQLAPDTPEHRQFFRRGEEIFLYGGTRECIDTAQRLLTLSPSEASHIREKARSRSVRDGYSYRHRAIQALNVMKGLCHE